MRILFVTQILPYPPDSGGKIKTLRILKILSKKHKVFLVCYAAQEEDLKHRRYLEKMGISVKVIVSNIPFDHFKNIRKIILKSLFSFDPFIVYRYRSKELIRVINEIIDREQIDAIHIDHFNLAFCLPKRKNQTWVLDEHNIESSLNFQIFVKERLNKFKLFSLLESIKIRIFEHRMVRKFDYCLAISKKDALILKRLGAKEGGVFFLPVFFKTENLFSFQKEKPVILFTGLLSWWPNKDGVLWFYRKVLPLVRERMSKAEFWVIGKQANSELVRFSKEDPYFKLFGYVKDLRLLMEKATVFVAPLMTGAGVRIKILTSLAYGIPIVSTTVGVEGLEVCSGRELLIADNYKDFADCVVGVLCKKCLAKRLSQKGTLFIKENYNQKRAERVLDKIYE